MEGKKGRGLHIKRYVISGIVTIIPLWITWLLLDFTFSQLARIGIPLVQTIDDEIGGELPQVAELLLKPWFREMVAVLIVLVGLYVLGWGVNRVLGKKLLEVVEKLLDRLPLVKTIYGSIKKLMGALQTEPGGIRRVVLIDFPHEHMKTVGLVTRLLTDVQTGRKLAAVYVPTTPNPTSGYLEIVPVERLVSTDWTIDEAMSFVISGGAVAPERFSFSRPTVSENLFEED
jgi:uncharacterized membrane protein